MEFWYTVRKLGDERLVKHVAVEAWKQREMKWMKDLRQSIREMGWGEVKLEDVETEQLPTEGDVEELCMERSEGVLEAGDE